MSSKVFVLLVLVAATFASPVPDELEDRSGRIVNGQAVQQGQFPYVASLRMADGMWHGCGAAIITNRWLLSAAHCPSRRPPSIFRIVVGSVFISRGGITHNIARFVDHPNFTLQPILQWDITCIQTTTNIVYNVNVQPIPLGGAVIGGGVQVRVTGWGATNPGNSVIPDQLRTLVTTTLSAADCRNRVGPMASDHKLCTQIANAGICGGDSGTPLAIGNQIVGVAAWTGLPCGGQIDGFVRVSSARSWILNTIG